MFLLSYPSLVVHLYHSNRIIKFITGIYLLLHSIFTIYAKFTNHRESGHTHVFYKMVDFRDIFDIK